MVLDVPIFKPIIIRLLFAQMFGHLKIINFPFETNGKLIILGDPNTYAQCGIIRLLPLPFDLRFF